MPPPQRSSTLASLLWLALALAVYVAVRWIWLSLAFDDTALTMYELYPMGTIPKVVAEGHSLPLHDYYDNAAGQLMTGLFALPFYAWFGQSYLALKLVPATLGALALVALFFFVRNLFGLKAAVVATFLGTLTPSALVKYSMVASGNHFENVVFSMFALATFFAAHRRGATRPWLFAEGVAAGFALFVFLGALIPIALLAFVHVGLRGLKQTLKDALVVVPGLVLGLLPLIVLNLGQDSRGLEFLDTRFGVERAAKAEGFFVRLGAFFGEHLPRAGVFPSLGSIDGLVPGIVLLALFSIAWLLLAKSSFRSAHELLRSFVSGRKDRETDLGSIALVPLVGYLPLCALAYAGSNLVVGAYGPPYVATGYRYFLLHHTIAAILIAVAFARWSEASRSTLSKFAAWSLLAIAFATAVFHWGEIDTPDARADVGARYEGFHYPFFARGLLGKRNHHDQADILSRIERVPAEQRPRVYYGIGYYLALESAAKSGGALDKLVLADALAGWPEGHRADVARGFGTLLRPKNGDVEQGRGKEVAKHLLDLFERKEPKIESMIAGLCAPWDYPLVYKTRSTLDENVRMLAFVDPALQPMIARGNGWFIGRLLARDIDCDVEEVARILKQIDDSFYPELCTGIGEGLVDGERSPHWSKDLTLVEARFLPYVYAGFAAELKRVFSGAELARIVAALRPTSPKAARAAFDKEGL